MLNFRQLARLESDELGRQDILDVHLACAERLPGSEKIDVARCHKIVDDLAARTKPYTEHVLAKGVKLEPDDTEAKIRVRAMIQMVWRGAGIRYNMAKLPDDCEWGIEDDFIHGALYGDGGTCATLPILYTAIGRRLGYPLKLVTAWGPKWFHNFCRWDAPNGEWFNIEANHTGVGFFPDDHYRDPGLTPLMEKQGRFLKSKTPREELAGFMVVRAHVCHDHARLRDCVDAYAWAAGLSPENEFHMGMFKNRWNDWIDEVKSREPPGFPRIVIYGNSRRYPAAFPLQMEAELIGLEAKDNLLRDPRHEVRFWRPLREGRVGMRTPKEVGVFPQPDDTVGLELRFGNIYKDLRPQGDAPCSTRSSAAGCMTTPRASPRAT